MNELEKRSIYSVLTRSKRRPMTQKDVAKAPKARGLYAIACEGVTPYLYVGQARERADEWGVQGRLEKHRISSGGPGGDNLANYLIEDNRLALHHGDATLLGTGDKRRAFFATKCHYQAVGLPRLTNDELNEAEVYAIGRSRPRLNRDDNPAPDWRLESPTRSLWDNDLVLGLALVIGFAVAAALVRWLIGQPKIPARQDRMPS